MRASNLLPLTDAVPCHAKLHTNALHRFIVASSDGVLGLDGLSC